MITLLVKVLLKLCARARVCMCVCVCVCVCVRARTNKISQDKALK